MRLFHRTFAALEILTDGFHDGYYRSLPAGVLMANRALDALDHVKGDCVLCIDIPDAAIAKYENVEADRGYREWIIPAAVVNNYGPPTVHQHDWQGVSREGIEKAARRRERFGDDYNRQYAEQIRRAIEFFDRFGWIGRRTSTD